MYIMLQLIYTEAAYNSGKWKDTSVGVHSWTVETMSWTGWEMQERERESGLWEIGQNRNNRK